MSIEVRAEIGRRTAPADVLSLFGKLGEGLESFRNAGLEGKAVENAVFGILRGKLDNNLSGDLAKIRRENPDLNPSEALLVLAEQKTTELLNHIQKSGLKVNGHNFKIDELSADSLRKAIAGAVSRRLETHRSRTMRTELPESMEATLASHVQSYLTQAASTGGAPDQFGPDPLIQAPEKGMEAALAVSLGFGGKVGLVGGVQIVANAYNTAIKEMADKGITLTPEEDKAFKEDLCKKFGELATKYKLSIDAGKLSQNLESLLSLSEKFASGKLTDLAVELLGKGDEATLAEVKAKEAELAKLLTDNGNDPQKAAMAIISQSIAANEAVQSGASTATEPTVGEFIGFLQDQIVGHGLRDVLVDGAPITEAQQQLLDKLFLAYIELTSPERYEAQRNAMIRSLKASGRSFDHLPPPDDMGFASFFQINELYKEAQQFLLIAKKTPNPGEAPAGGSANTAGGGTGSTSTGRQYDDATAP